MDHLQSTRAPQAQALVVLTFARPSQDMSPKLSPMAGDVLQCYGAIQQGFAGRDILQATIQHSPTSEMPDTSMTDLGTFNEGGRSLLATGGHAGTKRRDASEHRSLGELSSTNYITCGEVEGVVGALTPVVGGVAQVFHDLLVELRLLLIAEVEEGEKEDRQEEG